MSAERTEQASEQRKKKARERGDIVRSRELTSSAALLAGLLVLRGAATAFPAAWERVFAGAVHLGEQHLTEGGDAGRELPNLFLPAFVPVAAVLAAAFAAAWGVGMMQSGGLQVRVAALAWKPGRLSPAANIRNLFSSRSIARAAKSLLPAAGLCAIGYNALRTVLFASPVNSMEHLPDAFAASYSVALGAAWISVGWSAVDYAVEWQSWNARLKMSKQELREEAKESNGNPLVKGKIRQIQRAMRKRKVKADLSRAAVVITNPTHYAVALEFSFDTMAAPRVLAKGRDLHAFEIREAAKWAGVPLVENPPLARSLFRSVDEGQAIPFELYSAVAAILAFLFRQEQQRAQSQSTGYSHAQTPRVHLPLLELSASTADAGDRA